MSQVASAMPRAVRDLDADTRGRAIDSLRASMADHQTEQGVFYDSAAWLIEARRA